MRLKEREWRSNTVPDVFHASVTQMIIIRWYYLLIKEGTLCRHVCSQQVVHLHSHEEQGRKRWR